MDDATIAPLMGGLALCMVILAVLGAGLNAQIYHLTERVDRLDPQGRDEDAGEEPEG